MAYTKRKLKLYRDIAFNEIFKASHFGRIYVNVYCPSDICNDFITSLRNDGFTINLSPTSRNRYIIDLSVLRDYINNNTDNV